MENVAEKHAKHIADDIYKSFPEFLTVIRVILELPKLANRIEPLQHSTHPFVRLCVCTSVCVRKVTMLLRPTGKLKFFAKNQ